MASTQTYSNTAIAEKYLADRDFDIGTVVRIGGPQEIYPASYQDYAIGVVCENPAIVLNSELENGTLVAIKGRVLVKLLGGCSKGDLLTPYGDACAASIVTLSAQGDTTVIPFAIALQDQTDPTITLIECHLI